VHPIRGEMKRVTVQPGSVQSYASADLYTQVSGYLKTQTVDIGDRVKVGQALAVIDVPGLEQQVARDTAMVEQAHAKVAVAKAHVDTARADLEVANSTVVKTEAAAASAKAMHKLREEQLTRYRELYASKSIDERLVQEKEEANTAAVEAEHSALAAIATAKAQVTAATAGVVQAQADVANAEASVKVAQAELGKSKVLIQFATITSPYNGVITRRNFWEGDFIKAAPEGTAPVPLLSVERTDLMRVVIQVPDRDVPFTNPGRPATVELDALPNQKFKAKVSRIAESEDPQTRLMRTEVDLPNPKSLIRKGMYGRVVIELEENSDRLSVPSSAVVDRMEEGKANVYVVRDGKATLVPVEIGIDNGLRVEIISGLKPDDDVVVDAPSNLHKGAKVVVTRAKGDKT
jgi:HlyD family secretion protein